MLFLALAASDDAWFASMPHETVAQALEAEARLTWELRSAGVVRDAWWRSDRRDVVLVLEARDEAAAKAAVEALPLVRIGAVRFEVVGLSPYDGWARLFAGQELLVERAVAWSLEHVGSPSYALRCLSFVEDAYEQPNRIEVFGGATARESADLYRARGNAPDAPRGSFVFFDTTGPADGELRDWGHVGIALGDGRLVHAWPEVRVDPIDAVPTLPSGDWSSPRYAGWAGPSTILDGARPAQPCAASSEASRRARCR